MYIAMSWCLFATSDLFFITFTESVTEIWHRCFPVNFEKFLRAPFSTKTRLVVVASDSSYP